MVKQYYSTYPIHAYEMGFWFDGIGQALTKQWERVMEKCHSIDRQSVRGSEEPDEGFVCRFSERLLYMPIHQLPQAILIHMLTWRAKIALQNALEKSQSDTKTNNIKWFSFSAISECIPFQRRTVTSGALTRMPNQTQCYSGRSPSNIACWMRVGYFIYISASVVFVFLRHSRVYEYCGMNVWQSSTMWCGVRFAFGWCGKVCMSWPMLWPLWIHSHSRWRIVQLFRVSPAWTFSMNIRAHNAA